MLEELNAAGLRISRRSKTVRQTVRRRKEDLIGEPSSFETTETAVTTEDEYEDFDSPDQGDDFERLDDIRGICDQIDWNVMNNDSTVYLLTTYLIADKIVCSLSDIEPDVEYDHVCEYGRSFLFRLPSGEIHHLLLRLQCSISASQILCAANMATVSIHYPVSSVPVRSSTVDFSARKVSRRCSVFGETTVWMKYASSSHDDDDESKQMQR